MVRKRLIWQIFPPFLLIILIALVSITWLFTIALSAFSRGEARRGLEAQGALIAHQVRNILVDGDPASLDSLSKTLGQQSGTRLTIILPTGEVIADSEEAPARMENHADRPEVVQALSGEIGETTRYSHTLQKEMMYVALPVVTQSGILASVRVSLPLASITRTLQSIIYQIINSGIAIAITAGLICLWLARRLSRPLEEMKRGAELFARGELDQRLPTYPGEELGGLSGAMNQMAAQLNDRIATEVRQRNEQEAVLSSMVEGVLAIDNQGKILRLNRAAAKLFEIDPEAAVGRSVHDTIHNPELIKFIKESFDSGTSIETDLTLLFQGEERSLQAHGTQLCDADEKKIGALIVINDVTRLRRLENIRRDFVANVSHELKTPITAIKGAVETLLDGANENLEDSKRFLDIAERQSDRLNAIIDDLLALSRLERDAESEGIVRSQQNLQPILESALQSCSRIAESKQIEVKLFSTEQLSARVNPALLEQAVINLIDNAIKYSNAKKIVTVEGWCHEGKIKISVQDRGQGIPKESIPRLFERFYRVDTARSRAVGGTGLGLAIVKHIAQAHSGEVSVESSFGEGSTFTITLPAA